METKKYIVVKDNKIIGHYHTSGGEAGVLKSIGDEPYDIITEVPVDNWDVRVGCDVREYDKNWTLRKLSSRVAEGLVDIPPAHTLDGEVIRPMILEERVASGIEQAPARMKAVGDEWLPMTEEEIIKSGQATKEEIEAEKKMIEREALIQSEIIRMAEERLAAAGKI